jgi:type I restriction enzyme, S subunit
MASEWREVAARDFCSSVRDGTHDSPKPVSDGRFLVTSRHITSGRLDLAKAYLISQADFDAINKRSRVDQWDVLVSMIGTVGETCLVKEEPTFAIKNIGLFKSKGEAEGRWLYYYLRSPYAQQLIREQARGTTQAYIPLNALRDFPISVPEDANEMRVIVDILGTLDDKIELNRRMNETLEAMARAIFKSWFVDFDPVRAKAEGRQPAGMDAGTAALFPGSFEESTIGSVPRSWTSGSLRDLVDLVVERVEARPEKHSLRYIALDDMPSRSLGVSYRMGSEVNSSITAFRRGDILFGSMRPYFHKVGLAPFDGITRTTTFVLRPRRPDLRSFALMQLFSDEVVAFSTTASVGTTIPYVKWDALGAYAVVLPPAATLTAFEGVLSPILNRIAASDEEDRTLAALRDTLLPRLLSGEIRVSAVEEAGAEA